MVQILCIRHDDEAREMLAEIADNCGKDKRKGNQVNDWNLWTA